RHAPEAPVAFAVLREVELVHGNPFAFDVVPDIELGPFEKRMHTDMPPVADIALEIIPDLGSLVFVVPGDVDVARGEVPLFRADAVLIAADADEERIEAALDNRLLQRHGLQLMTAGERVVSRITDATLQRLLIFLDD